MATTVIGLFTHAEDARQTRQDLVDQGFPDDHMFLDEIDLDGKTPDTRQIWALERLGMAIFMACFGAIVGFMLGIFVGMGFLGAAAAGLVPPGGSLVSGITWATLGAVAGALIGALLGIVSDYLAHMLHYEFSPLFETNGTALMVQLPADQVRRATTIMRAHQPVSIQAGDLDGEFY